MREPIAIVPRITTNNTNRVNRTTKTTMAVMDNRKRMMTDIEKTTITIVRYSKNANNNKRKTIQKIIKDRKKKRRKRGANRMIKNISREERSSGQEENS